MIKSILSIFAVIVQWFSPEVRKEKKLESYRKTLREYTKRVEKALIRNDAEELAKLDEEMEQIRIEIEELG